MYGVQPHLPGPRPRILTAASRSVGCILGELLLKRPFMAGKSEADQLLVMARVLGAPNTRIWPGMRDLPNYEVVRVGDVHARIVHAHAAHLVSGSWMWPAWSLAAPSMACGGASRT